LSADRTVDGEGKNPDDGDDTRYVSPSALNARFLDQQYDGTCDRQQQKEAVVGASEHASDVAVYGARERVIPDITLFILALHLCQAMVGGDGLQHLSQINDL
jgi:hypothetical protein